MKHLTAREKFALIITELEDYGYAQTAIDYARELQDTFAPLKVYIAPDCGTPTEDFEPDCGTPMLEASQEELSKLLKDTGC